MGEAMNDSAKLVEASVKSAYDELETMTKSLKEKEAQMGGAERSVKNELWDMHDKLSAAKKNLSKLESTVKTLREKAARKANALQFREKRKAEFAVHDKDRDGKLSRKEVTAFAESTYGFGVPQDTLDKIMRVLEPVQVDKFQRMRGMVAIAKAEVQARAKRAEAEEKKRILEEQRTAMQAGLDEAASLLTKAEETASKAETDARPLTSRAATSMSAEDITTSADQIEELAKQAAQELDEAMVKLTEVDENEDYKDFEKRDSPRLKSRYEKIKARVEKVETTAKGAKEKAVPKLTRKWKRRGHRSLRSSAAR